jgi:transposase
VLSLPPSVRLFVASQAVDGRKGTDSLMVLVRDVLQQDPLSGYLFIFFSKRRDRVRIVYIGVATVSRCGRSALKLADFLQLFPPTASSPSRSWTLPS